MNIPIKVLKNNSIPNEKVRNQQKIAQKYYNSVNNNKTKNNSNCNNKNLNENSTSQNLIKNIHNIFEINNLKEEIIRWFFSFDLNNKFILGSIENKWLINCLHFMYLKQKNEPNLRFSYLDGEAPDCGLENFHHKTTKPQAIFTNKKMNNNLYFQYFSSSEDSKKSNYSTLSTNYNSLNNYNNYANFVNTNNQPDFDIFKEINFYKCEESDILNDYCSYMTLSQNLVENEVFFLKLFDHYSNGKAFMNFIPALWDQQAKFYTYGLPEWLKKKEYYSLQEIIVAFFEQAITVKFVLFHLDPLNYNFYYNKYLKNSYLKQLKEENNPAIYNDSIEQYQNFYKRQLNITEKENIEENLIEKCNSYSNVSISNLPINGEYGYHFNYKSILDSPNGKTNLLNKSSSSTNKLNIGFNFTEMQLEHATNPIINTNKNDCEKHLIINDSNQFSPQAKNAKKNFNFIKSYNNIRIHLEKERSYPKGISEISDFDCYLKILLRERSEILSIYHNEIQSIESLYIKSKGEKLIDEIKENVELKDLLKNKSFNPQVFISFNRYSKLIKKVSFSEPEEKENLFFDINLKYFFTSHKSAEELLDNIIFLDFNQIFTYDDIILKRLFDNIYSIYTYKNVLELLALEENGDSGEKLVNNNNKDGKKKKKRKNTKKSIDFTDNNDKKSDTNPNVNENLKNTNKLKKDNKINNETNINNFKKIDLDAKEKIDIRSNVSNLKSIPIKEHVGNCIEMNKVTDVSISNKLDEKKKNSINNNENNKDSYCDNKINLVNNDILNQKFENKNNKSIDNYNNFNDVNSTNDNFNNFSFDNGSKLNEQKSEALINNCKNNFITYENKKKENSNESDKENKLKADALKSENKKETSENIEKFQKNFKNMPNQNLIKKRSDSNKRDIKKEKYNNIIHQNENKNNTFDNNKEEFFIVNKRPNSNSNFEDLTEEKKDFVLVENSWENDKLINHKDLNLKDILNLEFYPKKKIENKIKTTLGKVNQEMKKEESILIKSKNHENDNIIYCDIISKIIDKIEMDKTNPKINEIDSKFISNYSSNEPNNFIVGKNNFENYDKNRIMKFSKLNKINDKLEYDKDIENKLCKEYWNKSSNININLLESSTGNGNRNKKDKFESDKEKALNSHITQMTFDTNSLTIHNSIRNRALGNINGNNPIELVISNESDSLKNENSQDKNENDTDTAYSSSNQSENNYNQEQTDANGCMDNFLNGDFHKNSTCYNNTTNLIHLRNNLKNANKKSPVNFSDLNINHSEMTDFKNINNYLISPKKIDDNVQINNININFVMQNNKFQNNEKTQSFNNNQGKMNKFDKNRIENKNLLGENLIYNHNEQKNDGKKTIDKKIESNLVNQEKNAFKLQFSLNPLAEIYNGSNTKKIELNSINKNPNKEEMRKFSLKENKEDPKMISNLADFNMNNMRNTFTNHSSSNNYLNSPDSVKSDKVYFNKKDFFKNQNYSSYNIGNKCNIYNQKPYNFNSPNSQKNKENIHFKNNDKKNQNYPQNQNSNNFKINGSSSNNLNKSENSKQIYPETNKFKNKNNQKKNTGNLNVSKDDLTIIKSKALIFQENTNTFNPVNSAVNNSMQLESKKIKYKNQTLQINTNSNRNCNINSNINPNLNSMNNTNLQNISTTQQTVNSRINQPVYQSYIPKNVNFRNFNFPMDLAPGFNMGFNPNFANFNYFYQMSQMNMNNMGFINLNAFNPGHNTGFFDNNFYRRLHNDIIEYNQKLEKNLELTKEIKLNVIKYLNEKIKNILNFLNIEIDIYGSFANDLSIESSDIDIIVKYEDNQNLNINDFENNPSPNANIDIDFIISYLTNEFNMIDCMEKVTPIYTASVPLIKLIINPEKIGEILIQKANSDTILTQKEELDNFSEKDKDKEFDKVKEKYFENYSSSNLIFEDSTKESKSEIKEENKIPSCENLINLNSSSKVNFEEIKLNNLSFNCQGQKSNLEKISDLKKSDLYKNYFFNKEELNKVKIDITFMENISNNFKSKDQTQLAVEFTKSYIKKYPEIDFIIKILKRLLQIQNLNNSFNGGLSSFTLFLMVLAFTKAFRNKSFLSNYYGLFLLEFLNFYMNFDFQNFLIDVNMDVPFLPITEMTENIPIVRNPFNSYLNAAKSSYRINELKELFSNVFEKLITAKNNFNANNTDNLIYSIIFKK